MTRCIYLSSADPRINIAGTVSELAAAFQAAGQTVAVFRPIVADASAADTGITYSAFHADEDTAMSALISRYEAFAHGVDVVIAQGSDWSDVTNVAELDLNAMAAANLNAPVIVVGNSTGLDQATPVFEKIFAAHCVPVLAVVADGQADGAALVSAFNQTVTTIRTPQAFVNQLTAMAKRELKTIVLPESSDDRILESAAIVAERGTAKIILLGEADTIHTRAKELGFELGGVQIVSPNDPDLVEKFAAKYAELRAKKGVTLEQARETLKDLSYFATMMIYFDMADGMVSGAINTTANTIKPSFEFIKTKPGVKVVSSSFMMCLPDRVIAVGDCAVNPNPTPEELADIAINCAKTAARFDIEPRVAMLSYSTAGSGKGPDVDAVTEATRIAKELAPELKLDGPIQFDAAIDPTVGKKKMPGSEVAGQATVFIFPDLNTGNNAYKAIQRTSGALAIGPVLQGLNKPVNDLSRGALVDDIVNTIAITAIQAQDDAK